MLVRNAVSRTGIRNSTVLTLTNAEEWLNTATSSGETVSRDKAMGLSAFYSAIKTVSDSMGKLPINIFYQNKKGKQQDKRHVLNHLLNLRPNRYMSAFWLKKVAAIQAMLYGSAYIWVGFDAAGKPNEMLLLPSEGTTRCIDLDTGREWYESTINGKMAKFSPDEMLQVMWTSYDGRVGVGLLTSAKETLATDNAAQQYAGKFYRNGARLSGIVEVPSELSKESKDVVRGEFEERYSGMTNAFRVGVLDFGMKYTPMGLPQRDAQFIESRGFSVEEISRFTGVPLYKLQTGKQSYQSNEQQGLDYVCNTLLTIVTQWEQEFGYRLFLNTELAKGYYLRFNLSSEMRGDDQSRSNFYEKMFRNGFYSINEVRGFEDMNAVPNGDEHFVTRNYMTLDEAVKGQVKTEPTAPGEPAQGGDTSG